MTELVEQNKDGDIADLARFIFHEYRNPGKVVLQETNMENAVELFQFLCELYISGAKLYNGMEPSEQIQSLFLLRDSTTGFMKERMISALSIDPTLEMRPASAGETAEVRYRFCVNPNDMTKSYLDDMVLGTRLAFKYTAS